jgi:hypothetical protein
VTGTGAPIGVGGGSATGCAERAGAGAGV